MSCRARRGFTLIEGTVTVILLAVVISAATISFSSPKRLGDDRQAQQAVAATFDALVNAQMAAGVTATVDPVTVLSAADNTRSFTPNTSTGPDVVSVASAAGGWGVAVATEDRCWLSRLNVPATQVWATAALGGTTACTGAAAAAFVVPPGAAATLSEPLQLP
jgi:prepilin-type N-terminal cleavage/methylation domain-containing protein